jgi:hypothetical protein
VVQWLCELGLVDGCPLLGVLGRGEQPERAVWPVGVVVDATRGPPWVGVPASQAAGVGAENGPSARPASVSAHRRSMTSPAMSHFVELPTTSVKRNVTIPLGSVMLSSRQLPDRTVDNAPQPVGPR